MLHTTRGITLLRMRRPLPDLPPAKATAEPSSNLSREAATLPQALFSFWRFKTRRILGRLLEEMAQVEERACQLEMEESRLWEKELNAGGGLLAQEVGDGYVQERLGDFSGGLDSAFAFPWTD
ncbi:hypothetical protein ACJZ2D_003078 [Fusarium nematophilum]